MKKTLILSTMLALVLDFVHYTRSPHLLAATVVASTSTARTTRSAGPAIKAKAATDPPPIVIPAPAPDPVTAAESKLSAAGLNPAYAGLYLSVQARTGTPWQLLAAVHMTETHQSGSTAIRSYAGAVGPFQFMPATWKVYALDGDNDGRTDITSLDDAALTAGRYLAAGGASHGSYTTALYHYNHSYTYVNHVLAIADRLGL